jgi:hypothetical protein
MLTHFVCNNSISFSHPYTYLSWHYSSKAILWSFFSVFCFTSIKLQNMFAYICFLVLFLVFFSWRLLLLFLLLLLLLFFPFHCSSVRISLHSLTWILWLVVLKTNIKATNFTYHNNIYNIVLSLTTNTYAPT